MLKDRLYLYSFLLIIIYLVGMTGMILFPDWFKPVTPVNLMLSAAFLFYFDRSNIRSLLLFAGIVWVAGFMVEYAGVYTGVLFGRYQYGPTLGYAIAGIPLLIGLNWFILTYCAANMSRWLLPLQNRYSQISAGAVFMVGMDALLERLCATLDFWYWHDGTAPLQNYIAWYICSWLFLFLFSAFHIDANNKAARVLYIVQTVFFVSLLSAQSSLW